jgi:hypothetical protein
LESKATYLPSELTEEAVEETNHQPLLALPKLPAASVEQAAMSPGAAVAGTPRRETSDKASVNDKRTAIEIVDFPGCEDFVKTVDGIRPTPQAIG